MRVVRGKDHLPVVREHPLPPVQRLIDHASGAESLTILINELRAGEQVSEHSHEVEEVLLVMSGHLSDFDSAAADRGVDCSPTATKELALDAESGELGRVSWIKGVRCGKTGVCLIATI